MELARRGRATVGISTERFSDFSAELLRQQNAAALGLAVTAHPIGGIAAREAEALVTDAVVDVVVAALTKPDALREPVMHRESGVLAKADASRARGALRYPDALEEPATAGEPTQPVRPTPQPGRGQQSE